MGGAVSYRSHPYSGFANRDVIGDTRYFDIFGMDVAFSGGFVNVKIYTDFKEGGPHTAGALYGDLFISTDSWHPNPYRDAMHHPDDAHHSHDDSTYAGEAWEYVFDNDAGLYQGAFMIDKTDVFFGQPNSPYIYRGRQETRRHGGGKLVAGGGSFDYSHAQGSAASYGSTSSYLLYHINLAGIGTPQCPIGLHWNMTCGNDTIEGQVTRVPEPAVLSLLAAGLVGLSAVRKRKRIHR